ncbi:MAG: SDR family NAD(P)-dependent oxidoreductase, partial [Ottowia sp.]|nr:SDR family NAD(P)-dependent oxidoreductase [Ottowia sp.]
CPVLVARSADRLAALAQSVRDAAGLDAITVPADATENAQMAALAERFGAAAQVLHYNAAIMRSRPWNETSPDDFVQELRVDIGAAYAAIQAFAPFMQRRASSSILLTGGGLALAPSPDYLGLSIGKAGIRCMAQALFPALSKGGVHIASVTVTRTVDIAAGDAEKIADMFWNLHQQPQGAWDWEAVY